MRVGKFSRRVSSSSAAFTLVEVVISAAFVALLYSGIITAYILSARRAEWSGYSLAAQALGMRALEQARQAKWDSSLGSTVDEITTNNFPPLTVTILDLPVSGNNVVYATNRLYLEPVTITSSLGPVQVKVMKVDTIWVFKGKLFTNTVATYIAPD